MTINRVYVINSYSAMESISCLENMVFLTYEGAEEYLLKFADHHKEINVEEDGILYVVDQYKHKDMEAYYIIKDLKVINN